MIMPRGTNKERRARPCYVSVLCDPDNGVCSFEDEDMEGPCAGGKRHCRRCHESWCAHHKAVFHDAPSTNPAAPDFDFCEFLGTLEMRSQPLLLSHAIGKLVGKKLREMREARGWGRTELYRKTGLAASVAKSRMAEIEKGSATGIRIGTLYAFALAFGVSPAAMLPKMADVRRLAGGQFLRRRRRCTVGESHHGRSSHPIGPGGDGGDRPPAAGGGRILEPRPAPAGGKAP